MFRNTDCCTYANLEQTFTVYSRWLKVTNPAQFSRKRSVKKGSERKEKLSSAIVVIKDFLEKTIWRDISKFILAEKNFISAICVANVLLKKPV